MNVTDHVHLELVPLKGDPFTIRYAGELAEFFFRADASSTSDGAYDDWVLKQSNPHRITDGDINAVNRTMRARTPAKCWASFTTVSADESWLCAIDADWDLFATPETEWSRHAVQTRLGEAFKAVMGPHRGAAVTTKVLHIKRPRLIPVCDSYVAATMGVQLWDSSDWPSLLELVIHLRKQGQANLDRLLTIQTRLREAGFERTLVRILDALLWMQANDRGEYMVFAQWLRKTYG